MQTYYYYKGVSAIDSSREQEIRSASVSVSTPGAAWITFVISKKVKSASISAIQNKFADIQECTCNFEGQTYWRAFLEMH